MTKRNEFNQYLTLHLITLFHIINRNYQVFRFQSIISSIDSFDKINNNYLCFKSFSCCCCC